MIKKFQQGGILAQIQQLPQEQQQLIMNAFVQWAQQKGVDVNQLLQDPNALEQALTQFMQEMQQQQVQAAKHGAKLNYIKDLKKVCAEDEELQYFKRGGNVDCGCVKKNKDGGKQEPKKQTVADKFKAMKAQKGAKTPKKLDEAAKDSILANKYNDQEVQTSKPGKYINGVWTPDRTKAPYAKNKNDKYLVGNYNSAKAREKQRKNREESKRGVPANLDKDGGKVKKAGTGCMIKSKFVKKGSKMKVGCHQLGGSLNGTPFIRTPYKSSFILSQPKQVGITGNSIMQPGLLNEVVVSAPDKRLRFDRRVNNIGGGRQIISESLFDYYMNGNEYLGDLAKTPAGRVIYTSPRGNDTLYYNDDYIINRGYAHPTGNAKWILGPTGFLQVTDYNNPRALTLWKKLIRKNIIVSNEDKNAVDRARKEK